MESSFWKDKKRLSRDYYIFNPNISIYLLKEYEKNPFEIKGLGGKIARNIDDDIEAEILKNAGDFGIIQGDFQKIIKNLDKGIKPEKIYDAAKGNIGVIKEKYELAKQSENDITTIVGWILDSIINDYQKPIRKKKVSKTSTFNDYSQRQYDYDDLEKKLLGWDK